MKMNNIVYIGIGSNQGDRYKNCTVAIEAMCASESIRLLKQSSFYLTEPWGVKEQDDFINLVIKIYWYENTSFFLSLAYERYINILPLASSIV